MFASLIDIFCAIDDFCKYFNELNNRFMITDCAKQRNRPSVTELAKSEMPPFHTSY